MTEYTTECIEFSGFTLNPKDRLLFSGRDRIDLKGRDFDVLVYLASHPNVFVTNQQLITDIWGNATHIEEANITNYVNKIRNALTDNDLKHPKFIETVHGRKGYRFIGLTQKVPCHQINLSRTSDESVSKTATSFQVESHKFVPFFFGAQSYAHFQTEPIVNQWTECKQIVAEEDLSLNILPTGIGVWHVRKKLEFETLTDLAIWRRKTYHEINANRHPICYRTQEFLSQLKSNKHDPLVKESGKLGYVLSFFELTLPAWDTQKELRTALKLLSCLTPLQSHEDDSTSRDQALHLERQFLMEDFPHADVLEFGLSGSNLGFASWAGVSFHDLSGHHMNLKNRIIQFEIALQALWWLVSCVKKACLISGSHGKSKLQEHIGAIIYHFGLLKMIGATESSSQRTMSEAVLTTSRLENLFDDTIKLYNQL